MNFCNADLALAQQVYLSTNITPADSDEDSAPNRALTPVECGSYQVRCSCFAPKQTQKIFNGITDLAKCQVDLASKDAYIKDRLVTWGAGQPVAFYQEPSFLIGGTVVSFALGAGVAAYLLRK